MLRLRSDEQLVALYRAGHEEAFRVIHDRYRQRLFAYTRQMLPGSRQDAEDALQDIFIRAYAGLRASDRQLALRAWLYRVAHNRCIDELRRPSLPPAELIALVRPPIHDPIAQAERRESLRRLIEDVRRLPGQQRSALLMRELGGMPYADLAAALGVSVPAVKSLLVRARIGLAQSGEARDTACGEIRNELIVAHDRGVRPSGMAKRHLRDCAGCREFRGQVRGTSRQLAALVPLGPLGLLANLFGFGGGAASGSAAGGGAAGTSVAGTVAGTGGAVASIGAVAGGRRDARRDADRGGCRHRWRSRRDPALGESYPAAVGLPRGRRAARLIGRRRTVRQRPGRRADEPIHVGGRFGEPAPGHRRDCAGTGGERRFDRRARGSAGGPDKPNLEHHWNEPAGRCELGVHAWRDAR